MPAHFARACRLIGRVLPAPTLDYCLARDGSATAKRDGQWLAGCSVPKRAAELTFRRENWAGRSLCLLAPSHGQQIAVVLDKLGPTKALIVIQPDVQILADMLASVDLTEPLCAGRLFFAEDESSLAALFPANPGLAIPGQMARCCDADGETVARIIAWAQPVFSRLTGGQAKRINAAAQLAEKKIADQPLLLVGRAFRLWNDVGHTLAGTLGGDDSRFRLLDSDQPTQAAEAYQAEVAAMAPAVIADRPRPAWARADHPWLTWLTRPAIPPFRPEFPRDGLLLADGAWIAAARNAGWPAQRVAVANWPALAVEPKPGAPLALIADLPSLDVPPDVAEWSVWQLSWEAMREELTRNPFALGDDAAKYVRRAPARLGLTADENYPVDRLVKDVVAPAYTLGMARWLAEKKVAFTLHGHGWQNEAALADQFKGPISDRGAFITALNASGGLIDPFLSPAHAIRAITLPQIKTVGRTSQRVMQDIGSLATQTATSSTQSQLSVSAINSLL